MEKKLVWHVVFHDYLLAEICFSVIIFVSLWGTKKREKT